MTFGKKLENFWYYNKWKTAAVIFAAAALAVGISQCTSQKKADYTVGLTTNRVLTQSETDIIASALTPYGEDINGDGKVIVKIYDFSYKSSQNDQIQQLNREKFQSELTAGSCILYITDSDKMEYFDENGLAESLEFYGSDAVPVRDTPVLEALSTGGFKNPEELYMLVRKVKGTVLEKTDPSSEKNYENALKMLKKIVSAKTGTQE